MSVLRKIERYLRTTNTTATKFGRLTVGDPRLVADLRNGRTPSEGYVSRIEAFLAGQGMAGSDAGRLAEVRPSDLPTKRVRAPDGSVVNVKVVQAESPTLGEDLLAAFRSNVHRIKREQRKHRAAQDAPEA